jgi:hypothetical protein
MVVKIIIHHRQFIHPSLSPVRLVVVPSARPVCSALNNNLGAAIGQVIAVHGAVAVNGAVAVTATK